MRQTKLASSLDSNQIKDYIIVRPKVDQSLRFTLFSHGLVLRLRSDAITLEIQMSTTRYDVYLIFCAFFSEVIQRTS